MRRTILAMLPVLALVAVLAACAMPRFVPSGVEPAAPVTAAPSTERLQAASAWLDATLANLDAAVATAKERQPETAGAVDASVGGCLDRLRSGAAAYRAALDSGQVETAEAKWPGLRALVSGATAALGPTAIAAMAGQ